MNKDRGSDSRQNYTSDPIVSLGYLVRLDGALVNFVYIVWNQLVYTIKPGSPTSLTLGFEGLDEHSPYFPLLFKTCKNE